MNKMECVAAIAEKSGLTKKASTEALEAMITVVSETVAKGEAVKISGFGVWELVDRAERQGRNPKSGEMMTIPAKKAPKFRAGKEFKEMVAKA